MSSSSITAKLSKVTILQVLRDVKCRILKRDAPKDRTVEIEAEKLLDHGRIHVLARYFSRGGRYIVNVRFDSEEHVSGSDTLHTDAGRILVWQF